MRNAALLTFALASASCDIEKQTPAPSEDAAAMERQAHREDVENCAELAREANPVRSLDINDPEFQKKLEQLVEDTKSWAQQCLETHHTTGEYPQVDLTSPSSAHSQNAVHQDQ